jgi:hypothetical protein
VSALLHAFTSSHPAPLPSFGDGVARKNLNKLQPLREALQQLRQEGLTKVHLLRTFFQPPDRTAPEAEDQDGDVSWTVLP